MTDHTNQPDRPDETPNERVRGTQTQDLEGKRVTRLGTPVQDAQDAGELAEGTGRVVRRGTPVQDASEQEER